MLIDVTLTSEYYDHRAGQIDTRSRLFSIVGFRARWHMGCGNAHTYRVQCTKEESLILALIADGGICTKHQSDLLAEKTRIESEIEKQLTRISDIDNLIGEI